MSVIGGEALTTVSTNPLHGLGETRYDSTTGKSYVFAQLSASAANAAVLGTLLYGTIADPNIATDDVSATHRNLVLGFALGAIPLGSFAWLQTWGRGLVRKGRTTVVDVMATGDLLVGNATADGVVQTMTAGTAPIYTPVASCPNSADSAVSLLSADICISRASS